MSSAAGWCGPARETNALLGHYACEGLGQRVRKTVGGVTTNFVYDENGAC